VNRELARAVKERASYRCEYCRVSQSCILLPFQIDHIRAEKHGGETKDTNLALACAHCNRHKGANTAGFDADIGEPIRLFHPRIDLWDNHFEAQGTYLRGKTAIGRVTVQVLRMNSQDQLLVRAALIREG